MPLSRSFDPRFAVTGRKFPYWFYLRSSWRNDGLWSPYQQGWQNSGLRMKKPPKKDIGRALLDEKGLDDEALDQVVAGAGNARAVAKPVDPWSQAVLDHSISVPAQDPLATTHRPTDDAKGVDDHAAEPGGRDPKK